LILDIFQPSLGIDENIILSHLDDEKINLQLHSIIQNSNKLSSSQILDSYYEREKNVHQELFSRYFKILKFFLNTNSQSGI
jgi:hypothetical protein